MTTAIPPGNAPAMIRWAVLPSAVTGAACVGVSAALAGPVGLWGALLGVVLVGGFFGLSLLVLGSTRRTDPLLTLLIAFALYAGKIVVLGIVFAVLSVAGLLGDPFDRTALGITLIVCTLTWITGELTAATKRREPLYDLNEAA